MIKNILVIQTSKLHHFHTFLFNILVKSFDKGTKYTWIKDMPTDFKQIDLRILPRRVKLNGKGKQECIPVGSVLSALYNMGGLPDRDSLDRGPPLTEPPPGQGSPQRPLPFWTKTSPVNRITDRCKNITFPELRLRTVINFDVCRHISCKT